MEQSFCCSIVCTILFYSMIASKSVIRLSSSVIRKLSSKSASLAIPNTVHSLHLKKSLLEVMHIFIRHHNVRDARKQFCIWKSGSAVSGHMEDSIPPKIILTTWDLFLGYQSQSMCTTT